MKKVIRLIESDLTRIVKRVINENVPSLDRERDELRSTSQRLMRSMDEYGSLQRKGDYKRMGDEVSHIRKLASDLEDIARKIKSKL
jgi:hypothetical protein